MQNVYMAGADLIRWDLVLLEPSDTYRLSVYHPRGVIVEYFTSITDALHREHELEELLAAARSHGATAPHVPSLSSALAG